MNQLTIRLVCDLVCYITITLKQRHRLNQGNHQLSGDEREMVRSVKSGLRANSLAVRLTFASV